MTNGRDRRVEDNLREAFDAVRVPADLTARTLAHIEAERAQQPPAAPAAPATPQKAPRRAGRRHVRRRALALAACLVLAALGIGGFIWAWQPTAYVAIDINPSLELGINRLDRVASARAYNADGEAVLAETALVGKTYEKALDALDGALDSYRTDDAVLALTIVCDDQARAAALESVGRRCLEHESGGSVRCAHASEEEHHEAAAAGLGLGKYRVWRALVAAGDDLSREDASALTMRELLDRAEAIGADLSAGEDGTSGGATAAHAADASGASASSHADDPATGGGDAAGAGHHGAHERHGR